MSRNAPVALNEFSKGQSKLVTSVIVAAPIHSVGHHPGTLARWQIEWHQHWEWLLGSLASCTITKGLLPSLEFCACVSHSPDGPSAHTFVSATDPSNLSKHGPAPALPSIYSFLRAVKASVLTSSLFQPYPRVRWNYHHTSPGQWLTSEDSQDAVCLFKTSGDHWKGIYLHKEGREVFLKDSECI